MSEPIPSRAESWKWLVCSMLMLAGMLNYMDRMTINSVVKSIEKELDFKHDRYGRIEAAFGIAFALGALGIGCLVDWFGVRWLFPICVLGWSLAGVLTGFAWDYESLLGFRFMLGLFEAALTPCGLWTTQQILTRQERGMGNGLLQSGPAIGAVVTPLIAVWLTDWTGSWRPAFWIIGILGIGWAVAWLAVVRPGELRRPSQAPQPAGQLQPGSARRSLLARRFLVLVVVVVSINLTWHFYRAWLSLFLQEDSGYSQTQAAYVMSGFYIAADLGSLAAGYFTLSLARRGLPVHTGRLLVYGGCAGLVTLSALAATLDRGPMLVGMFLVIGFGALGVFPCYYSFSQELTSRNQGKVTGLLSFCCWSSIAAMQWMAGEHIENTKSYTLAVTIAGYLPLIGLLALLLLWGRDQPADAHSAVALPPGEPYKDSEGTHPAQPGPAGITTTPREKP